MTSSIQSSPFHPAVFQIFSFKRVHQSRGKCRKGKLNLMHENRSDSEAISQSVPPVLPCKKRMSEISREAASYGNFLLFTVAFYPRSIRSFVTHNMFIFLTKAIYCRSLAGLLGYTCATYWHGHCASKCRTSLYLAASTWRLDDAFRKRLFKVFLSYRSVRAIWCPKGQDLIKQCTEWKPIR